MHSFVPFVTFIVLLTVTAPSAIASEEPAPAAPHGSWHHPEGHHVTRLFKQSRSLPIGSPGWAAQYPDPANFPPQNIPQSWTDALNAAVAAGKIPNIPIPAIGPQGSPVYPKGLDPTGSEVCSATYQCRGAGDLWDAPAGTVALSFDDGPLAPSPRLYKFLKGNNVHATHFFIGGNVRMNPQIFMQAFQDNQDPVAVHTYTHPYMTIQNNTNVLAELGFTIQIIYDSTGGRIPRFWRPPYGDVDNRVRAIAKEVFGLTTVIWNQNSNDWSLTYGAIPLSTVEASLTGFYKLPKSPGLMILEHELSENAVTAFIDTWGVMRSENWKPITIADTTNPTTDPHHAWYQNGLNDTANIVSMSFGAAVLTTSSTASPGSSTGSSGSTSSGLGVTTTTRTTGSSISTTTTTTTTSATQSTKTGGALLTRVPSAFLIGIAFLFTSFV